MKRKFWKKAGCLSEPERDALLLTLVVGMARTLGSLEATTEDIDKYNNRGLITSSKDKAREAMNLTLQEAREILSTDAHWILKKLRGL